MDDKTNLCQIDSQNYHETNRKSECTDDENANPSDVNELNNNTNELFDFDSSDLDYDSSDMDREDVKNLLLQTVNSENDNHTIQGQCINNCISESSVMPTEIHSNDNVSDTKEIDNIRNDVSMPADNCIQDNETTVTSNDEYIEDEEPIFDFLGKANEIVCCFFCEFMFECILTRAIYLIQLHPLITNTRIIR